MQDIQFLFLMYFSLERKVLPIYIGTSASSSTQDITPLACTSPWLGCSNICDFNCWSLMAMQTSLTICYFLQFGVYNCYTFDAQESKNQAQIISSSYQVVFYFLFALMNASHFVRLPWYSCSATVPSAYEFTCTVYCLRACENSNFLLLYKNLV